MIVNNNEAKYHQVERGGQILTPEFLSILGNCGEGSGVEAVLNGNLAYPEDTTASTNDFLEACKYTKGVKSLPSNKDIILKYRSTLRSWKVRRERTMTYNQYIGHRKIAMNDKFISWFFFQRGEIATNSGYYHTHLCTCVNLMISRR